MVAEGIDVGALRRRFAGESPERREQAELLLALCAHAWADWRASQRALEGRLCRDALRDFFALLEGWGAADARDAESSVASLMREFEAAERERAGQSGV